MGLGRKCPVSDGAKLCRCVCEYRLNGKSVELESIGNMIHGAPLLLSSEARNWYAVRTRARHEKRVRERLEQRAVEAFLPLYETLRPWKDRNANIQMPLFPGYLFVRFNLADRLQVLQVAGVVKLVEFGGRAAELPSAEIEALRSGLFAGIQVEPHPFLTVGQRVRVSSGPLQGLIGIVVKRKKKERFVVSVASIGRSFAVEVAGLELQVI